MNPLHRDLHDPRLKHPGDELDCPVCRTQLYEALRAPVEGPEECPPVPARPVRSPAADRGSRECLEPELCTADDPCPVCEGSDEPGLDTARPGHEVRFETNSSLARPGCGFWHVRCSCGWRKSGVYGVPGKPWDFQHARETAHRWARHHLNATKENGS